MAKCARCGKGGWFFKVNAYGLCADCDLTRVKEEAAERERRAHEEERRRQEEAKPFDPPKAGILGEQLVYAYDDVEIYVPDECRKSADLVKRKTELELKLEPENPYDGGAVSVYAGGKKIGYLYKNKLQSMAYDYIKRRDTVVAVMGQKLSEKFVIGLYFYLGIDEFTEKAKKKFKCSEYTLTGNTNEEMQDALNCTSVGEPVDFSYDYDKEKYSVSAGYADIGFMPSSASKVNLDECPYGFVSKLVERDSGKMSVSVMVVEGFTPGRF